MSHLFHYLEPQETLRLIWPQWQGAGRENVSQLLPELPIERARRGYAVGSRVLHAILPSHDGPTEFVDVDGGDPDEGSTGGIESRSAILASLDQANTALARHNFQRILTIGGECSVSIAPFSALANKYDDDLAVVWIDSHPDTDTPDTEYNGYHAMAVSTLLGYGDPEVQSKLPATVSAERLALAGLHEWTEDAYENIARWGLTSFSPDQIRGGSTPLLEWLARTGATKVAIHLDVDTVDSNEAALGLGKVPGSLSTGQIRRLITDITDSADLVGFTIAEFIPRDVLALETLLNGLPLINS